MDADLLTDMVVFAAVVEHNSFSSAAQSLQMSKSNVSRRIALLEQRLQIKLMHRTTRKLGLTESGRVYYDHCARLVAGVQEADVAIKAMHSSPSGILNVSLPETLGRVFILPILPEFMEKYADIRLNLTISNRKVDMIEERCDVAIRKGAIEDETLCAVPLGSSTQYFYASPGYISAAGHPATPEDLNHHDFLASSISIGPTDIAVFKGKDSLNVRVSPRISVRDHEAILSLTVAGLGISLLPVWMARDHVRKGQLVPILPEWRGPSVDFNVVFQPHRGMAPNLRAFIDFVKEKFKAHKPWEYEAQNKVNLELIG